MLAERAFRWVDVHVRIERLSPREHEVFRLLGEGHDNRRIARVMGVSERTVKMHITHVLRKLVLSSRLQIGLAAAEYALRTVDAVEGTAPP